MNPIKSNYPCVTQLGVGPYAPRAMSINTDMTVFGSAGLTGVSVRILKNDAGVPGGMSHVFIHSHPKTQLSNHDISYNSRAELPMMLQILQCMYHQIPMN